MIKKENLIYELESFYNIDMQELLDNYRAVEKLSPAILKELDVNVSGLKEGLKQRIKGLKNVYWKELFDNLESITNRLTSDSRYKLLEKLMKNTNVDFTANNAFAIVLWVIKNSNDYFDKQLINLYMKLSDKDNVQLYKSNKKIIEDGWRYNKQEMSHYFLDYRIIVHGSRPAFKTDSYYSYYYHYGLYNDYTVLIDDIFTIAKNLGFNIIDSAKNRNWHAGERQEFYIDKELFCDIKAFKNGNIHFRFNQEFMKKFNIEAARLNNWIKYAEEAVEEFNDLTLEEATKYFKSNIQITNKNVKLLLDYTTD